MGSMSLGHWLIVLVIVVLVFGTKKLANIGSDWQIDGVGDFNHDGTGDILMHRDSGGVRTLEILTINNNAIVGATVVGTVVGTSPGGTGPVVGSASWLPASPA